MVTISSPLWSLFPMTRRHSSSLIHIKLDKTNFFFYGLNLSKDYRAHIFLFYFLFEIFPILLLILICISHFNFILVWFNLGFLWSNVGETSEQLGVSLKILGRGKTKPICIPCEIHKSFRMGCENLADHANQFRTPNAISHAVRKSKDVVWKQKVTLTSLFKPSEPYFPIS